MLHILIVAAVIAAIVIAIALAVTGRRGRIR